MNPVDIENLKVQLGDSTILENLSFRVGEGDFVVIVGPNGAGKTTLFKALLGLVTPSGGQVRLFERATGQVPPEWVGYVPQVKTLDRFFPALAIELVVSGLRRRWPARITADERETALKALARVGGDHLAERPLGWLSGGELQRVHLARSLVHGPRLILLDEPATGIDAAGETDMYHILEEYRREKKATILMVTHDWGAAYHHGSHALVLNHRVISFGKPEEALRDEFLRTAFGHVGHLHKMGLGGNGHA